MRNKLRRYYGQGDLHFATFSCYRRRPLLGSVRARDRFVRILADVRRKHDFGLVGYVVMPEHVHLLLSEPRVGTISKVLQVLKQRTSRVLRGKKKRNYSRQLMLQFSGRGNEPAHLWQRRFYDFNVWSWGKRKEKLEYMHRNPVARKLVSHPRDWPWSSWSFYENGEDGLIRIDPVE